MKQILTYFYLRMRQFSHDTTALLFAYFVPIAALVLVGFTSQQSVTSVSVRYSVTGVESQIRPAVEKALLASSLNSGVEFVVSEASDDIMKSEVKENKLSFFLQISGDSTGLKKSLFYNRKDSHNDVYAVAVAGIVDRQFPGAFVDKQILTNRGSSYMDIFFPGMLSFTALLIGLTGFGSYVLQDRSRNVFKKLKTIDANPASYIYGIVLSRFFALITLFVAYAFIAPLGFGYQFQGNWLLGFALFFLICIIFLALGLLIASWSKSVDTFSALVTVIQIALIVTGGVFFSLDAYPEIVRNIFAYSPLSAFTSGFQILATQTPELGFSGVLTPLIVLLVWAVILVPWSLKRFKW